MGRFYGLCLMLSPAMLQPAGDRPRAAVQSLYKKIGTAWIQLEHEAGRKVSEAEVHGWQARRSRMFQ